MQTGYTTTEDRIHCAYVGRMPQHELPTIVFQPFPHGRPKEYQQPGIVDIMLANLPPQVFPTPPPPAPAHPAPASPPKLPAKPPTPRVEVEAAFKDALIEEIMRISEPVKITKFVTEYGRDSFSKGNWKDFESRKVNLLRQVEQLIRDKVLERIARRYVSLPRPIHPSKLHYFISRLVNR